MIPVFSIGSYKTVTISSGSIEESISAKAIVLKDEIVYKSEAQGTVSLLKEEGEKVGRGVQVVKINRIDGSSYSKELEEIEKQIDVLKNTSGSDEVYTNDKEKINDSIDIIINKLQDSILNGDYYEASVYKDNLLQNIDKQQLVTGQKSLLSQSIDSLLEKRDKIIKNIETSDIISYSPKAGIVSYQLDGLEDVFSANKIDDYKPGDFRIIDIVKTDLKEKDQVKYGDPVYKIINNFTWYLMTEIDAKDMDKLEENKLIYIKINDKDKKITSRIVKLVKNKDKYFMILKLTEYFHEFYNERYLDIKIVKNTFQGLMIPNKSIIEKDGMKGVYIKDISGIVKFRPIKILTSNDEYTIVSEGNSNSKIELIVDGETQQFTTVKMFDEVFLDGSKLKEGLIID